MKKNKLNKKKVKNIDQNQEKQEVKTTKKEEEIVIDISQVDQYQDRLNQIKDQGIYEAFQYILNSYYNGGMKEDVNIFDFAINRLQKFEVKFKVKQKKSQRIQNFKNPKKKVEEF